MIERYVMGEGPPEDRGEEFFFLCPGCGEYHAIRTKWEKGSWERHLAQLNLVGIPPPSRPPTWSWDGNKTSPTFSPSLLVKRTGLKGDHVCHSFVRGGAIEFLSDCTHDLRGKTVPLGPIVEEG